MHILKHTAWLDDEVNAAEEDPQWNLTKLDSMCLNRWSLGGVTTWSILAAARLAGYANK